MRGRGLKLVVPTAPVKVSVVAPHAGAWIETLIHRYSQWRRTGRPPCGGVD